MRAHRFEGANVNAVAPAGFEEMIGDIHGFHNGAAWVTAWKPDPEELEEFIQYLRDGGMIYASVMSGSKHDIRGQFRPTIIPMFIGTEEICERVVSDTGRTWKNGQGL